VTNLDESVDPGKGNRRRIAAVFAINLALIALIGATFFVQDYRYSLPTPRPKGFTPAELRRKIAIPYPDGRPVLLDPTGSWSKKCGVYSTPQAVVLDRNDRIVFSGNFNSTRFCSENATQFARIALTAVVAHKPVPPMPASATTPYGCSIVPKESGK
jgi:hypothetical protein